MSTELREEWLAALKTWVAFERVCGFLEMRSGLPTTSRPPEIGTWIQYARKISIVPKDPNTYVTQWWKWWTAINPGWREIRDGRPVIGGAGDWSALYRSGRNGFLTVLASLAGLRLAVVKAKQAAGTKRVQVDDDEAENNGPEEPEHAHREHPRNVLIQGLATCARIKCCSKLFLRNPLLRRPDATLPSSVYLHISFNGQLPARLSQTEMPLEVAVSIPYEFVNHVAPVIHATSIALPEQEDQGERQGDISYITFLPLRGDFDLYRTSHWRELVKEIRDWLLDVIVDRHAPEWAWGSDLYWIAIFGAYPNFEHLPWGSFDRRVGMSDAFGDQWVMNRIGRAEHDGSCTEETTCPACKRIQERLWNGFAKTARLYYGDLIVASALRCTSVL
ncbi:hypothetical protein NM688_g9029 [Phlebia brevispora]|uniref:Uncharacterized protein n=1 Tax=Phlebia brevispora TaxID=194682 RepID=A0ACC1RPJ3_9APHY|nr:hypothetical protein NM688_g9029 [Phlebia brevispora]